MVELDIKNPNFKTKYLKKPMISGILHVLTKLICTANLYSQIPQNFLKNVELEDQFYNDHILNMKYAWLIMQKPLFWAVTRHINGANQADHRVDHYLSLVVKR